MNNEAYVIPVSDRIKDLVIKFINSVLTTESREFTSGQLRSYVNLATDNQVAPGSPDRILRDLRAKGKVNYFVQNRGKSLYKALPLVGTDRVKNVERLSPFESDKQALARVIARDTRNIDIETRNIDIDDGC